MSEKQIDPDYVKMITNVKPIRRKSSMPYPKAACVACHNHDPEGCLGYTCLILGTTPEDPERLRLCAWYIKKGQSVLVLGEKGAV